MKIVVLKFGGTSVGSLNRIKNVSKIIANFIKKKYLDKFGINADIFNVEFSNGVEILD